MYIKHTETFNLQFSLTSWYVSTPPSPVVTQLTNPQTFHDFMFFIYNIYASKPVVKIFTQNLKLNLIYGCFSNVHYISHTTGINNQELIIIYLFP